MSLSDIKNKLYKRETDVDLSSHAESEFDVHSDLADPAGEKFTGEDAWEEKKEGLGGEQRKAIRYGAYALGGVFLILLIIFGFYKYKQSSFSTDRVGIVINGAKEVQSGKMTTYEISYKNNNRAALSQAVLRLNFPDNFKPEDNPSFIPEGSSSGKFDLGEIKGYAEDKIVFRGKVFSPKGSLVYLKAELSYKPSGFNSQYVNQEQLGINVISFPVVLEILAPQNLASGDSLDYLLSYKNTSEEDFENMKLKVEFPEGFIFSKSDPAPSEGNNAWYIGHLSVGQEGKINISGRLEGSHDDAKVLRAEMGSVEGGEFISYNKESVMTKIGVSPLSISQTVNGLKNLTAKAGDVLRFEITYKNDGNIGLRDAIVTEKIDSAALDYATLSSGGGAFDSSNNTMTWKAADYKNLANLEPGGGGKIIFSIKIKDAITVKNANDKNFVISSIAKIDSPDIVTPVAENKVIAGNKIDIKINTKLSLVVKGYYNDAVIKNFGPLPPMVGKETSYAIHWLAFNASNDIADAQVEATLPTGVTMTGVKNPENANLTYNERNNKVVWQIGNLPAGTGVTTSPRELVFQVKLTPAPNQINSLLDLAGIPTFTAHDPFTDEDLSVAGEAKSTMLTEDPTIGDKYKVQPAT